MLRKVRLLHFYLSDMQFFFRFILVGLLSFILFSCNVYRRDILFKAPKEKEQEFARNALSIVTPPNYMLMKNDHFQFSIFTNKGEAIIDPTSEFVKQVSSGSGNTFGSNKYLIQADGCADLPILGHVKLDSLTLHQVDSILSVKYGQYYQDVFVLSKAFNRKVYIMGMGTGGSLGGLMGGGMMGGGMGGGMMGGGGGGGGSGGGRVYEMERENMTLFEVIASNGGIGRYSYSNRVKIIRGNIKNPVIFTVDLTTWDSYQKANIIMQPNDIIYIEPLRRGLLEFLNDFTGISAFATTILSVILITRL
jgi:polysaccharide export outer membrane protein